MTKAINTLAYSCTIAMFGLAGWAAFGIDDVVLTTFAGLGGCCALIVARIDQL